MVIGKRRKTGEGLTGGAYYGRSQDFFRIYDQYDELRYRGGPLDFPFSTSVDEEVPKAITRVERQLRGAKIPPDRKYFGLLKEASEFNPFAPLLFETHCRVPFGQDTVRNTLAAAGLERLIEIERMQVVRSLINYHSSGNASRLMNSVAEIRALPGPDLQEFYRQETLKQLEGD